MNLKFYGISRNVTEIELGVIKGVLVCKENYYNTGKSENAKNGATKRVRPDEEESSCKKQKNGVDNLEK